MAKKSFGYGRYFTESSGGKETVIKPKCYESHPILKIGGGEILGGNCHHPKGGFHTYVGLDWGMAPNSKAFPWTPEKEKVTLINFYIRDGFPPDVNKINDFKTMVEFLCNQLQSGKRIHIGCIGGHGRTGTLIAAIAGTLKIKSPIFWVRKNYCHKAVESEEQIDFLMSKYGAEKAKPSKGNGSYSVSTDYFSSSKTIPITSAAPTASPIAFAPAVSDKCIWNPDI